MPKKYAVYHLSNGEKVPSVTQVLGVIAKEALYGWYGKHGTEKAQQILKESGEFGNKVHTIIESSINGQQATLTKDEQIILNNFKTVTDALVGAWEWHEKEIISEHFRYGGTADHCFIDTNGRRVLADVKTSNGVYPEFALQLCAYKQALEEMGVEIDYSIIFHLGKETKLWSVVYPDTDCFGAFKAALEIYNWRKENK